MAPVKRPANYADIEALSEHQVGEIVDGELFVSPRPANRHALAGSVLGTLLQSRFQFGEGGPGGWWILDEPEVHFQRNVVVPDIAGWRRERMPEVPAAAHFTLAPDWICEVLSPSTGRIDRSRKLPLYAKEGVPYVWLVDPEQRTVEVLVLHAGRYSIVMDEVRDDDELRAPPFQDVGLPTKRLWGAEP